MIRYILALLLSIYFIGNALPCIAADQPIEQWGIFEVELKGPAHGNPFVDVQLSASFSTADMAAQPRPAIAGFYDGDGTYRIRFMPDKQGPWDYVTSSNRPELDGKRGTFTVVAPSPGNHGPVRVRNKYHFAYADGTPHYSFGTTCYAWIHQNESLQEQTLETLKSAPFNKIRMCVFPKWYAYNAQEPPRYPFEKPGALTKLNPKDAPPVEGQARKVKNNPEDLWDLARFNPEFFHHLEKRIGQLRDLNIEADLILFHPYDDGHWGFDHMSAEADDHYLRYVVARLAAYRNIWWSLANEYDLLRAKKETDWDRFFQIIAAGDPYGHLRGIHNCRETYNHTHPWVTHVSFQNGSAVEDVGRAQILRDVYRKPIVYDEVKYEGNLPQRWGNLSPEDMMHRFWCGTIGGTYVGHGETYRSPDNIIWWAAGGKLKGQSPPRITFLRNIVEAGPAEGINQIDKWQDMRTAGKINEYYLVYFGKETPTEWTFSLPTGKQPFQPAKYRAELIDAWDMTITPLDGVFDLTKKDDYRIICPNRPTLQLPGKPYIALRITRIRDTD